MTKTNATIEVGSKSCRAETKMTIETMNTKTAAMSSRNNLIMLAVYVGQPFGLLGAF